MSGRDSAWWQVPAMLVLFVLALGCPPMGPPNNGGDGDDTPPVLTGPRVYGRVFDAATDLPLAGVTVAAEGVSTPAQTDAEGRFALTVPTAGSYALTARLANYTYAQRRAEVVGGGPAAVKDMYLTPVDPQAIRIGPGGGSGANSTGTIELNVPAGALGATTDMRATWYEEGRHLPNDLPTLTHFTYACDFEPDGQTFAAPVTVRMRNTRGFAPGTPIPVGVYNPQTLTWEHESMGTVSADGVWVEYTVGHFSPRDCNLGRTSPAGSGEPGDARDTTADQRVERNNQACGSVPAGSRVDVADGHLMVDHLLPAYTTLGQRRTVALQYNSPVPSGGVMLELSYDISRTGTALPERHRFIASIGGQRVERTYAPVEGPATFTYRWDGRDPLGNALPAGSYPYTLTLVNEYATTFATVDAFGMPATGDTGVAADEFLNLATNFSGTAILPEELPTAMTGVCGAGWGVVGLHHLAVVGTTATIRGGDGSRFGFTVDDGGAFAAWRGDSSTLVRNGDGTYTWTQPDGLRVGFDAGGFQTAIADRHGNATSFAYSDGRLVQVTDPVGRVTTLAYDASGRLSAITDPAGRVTQFTVDGNGDLVRIVNPDGGERQFAYDAQHRMVSQTDAGGRATAYAYDAAGAVTRVDRPDGTHTLHAAANAGQASYTDPAGQVYLFAVNSYGTRTAITDPLGRTLLMGRNEDDQISTLVTPGGKRVDCTYDERGNLATASAYGRSSGWPDLVTLTYDAALNLPTRIVDDMAGTWLASYDGQGALAEATLPGGRRHTCTYNTRGQRLSLTVDGATTSFTYNAEGNLATITNGEGGVWQYGYDAYGNINSVTDADGRTWALVYNAMNLVEQITNGLGQTVSFTYVPAQGSLDIDLDGAVAVASGITDGRGHATTFTYDALYRPTEITDPLGNVTRLAYDACGRLVMRTEPTGATASYTYNAAGQLIGRTLSVGESATYTYDATTGRCTSMATPTCRVDYTYNWFDLVSTATTEFPVSGLSASLTYVYRASNYAETLITLAVGANASDFGYGWTPTGGWWPEQWYGGGFFWLYTTFDAVGRPLGWYESYSGTQLDHVYDRAGRLTATTLTGTGGGGTATWAYSPAGYRTAMDGVDGPHSYAYDGAGRLVEATHPTPDNPTERYTYDAAGNRRVQGREADYVYDAANRLTRDITFDYTYDASGNVAQRRNRATGATMSYAYDAENRLIGVTLPAGGTISYRYDALGRLCERRSGAAVSQYVYERDEIIAEFNGSGGLRRQFVHGPGLDRLEGLKEGGWGSYTNYVYARDPVGTIMAVTEMDGNVRAEYRYQAFGRPVYAAGALGDARGFAGREYDGQAGLYHFRRRFYDPLSGRFLQRDPLPVAAALAPYVYAGNNPVNARDPYGLEPVSEGAALGGLANQYVVQPAINNTVSTGLGYAAGLTTSPLGGALGVAGVAWGQYYGTDGHPSWSDVVSVYGAENPAQAGVNWYGSQWWNPARHHLDDFLTLGGILPRREARLGPVCGLREGLRSFFGY